MAENATAEAETLPDDEGRPLEVYEWGGAIVAMLGFLFTPAVTGLPATYCALKIREEKPLAAVGIGIALTVTALFWFGFLLGEQVMTALVGRMTLVTISVVTVLLFGAVFISVLYLFSIVGQDSHKKE